MKSDILFVETIFCPCEELFELNKMSLISLFDYLEKYPYTLDICLGGWCIENKFWNELYKICIDRFDKLDNAGTILMERFDHNYGKAYTVNKLFENYRSNIDLKYILTFDSDIRFNLKEKNIFDRLKTASKIIEQETNKSFGCISINLKPNQYNDLRKNKSFVYDNEELLWDSVFNGGYSGGAIFLNVDAWKNVNGYKIYNQPYAPEDTHLFFSLDSANYCVAIINSMFMIHPPNRNEIYMQWKRDVYNRKEWLKTEFNHVDLLGHALASENFWRKFNGQN